MAAGTWEVLIQSRQYDTFGKVFFFSFFFRQEKQKGNREKDCFGKERSLTGSRKGTPYTALEPSEAFMLTHPRARR